MEQEWDEEGAEDELPEEELAAKVLWATELAAILWDTGPPDPKRRARLVEFIKEAIWTVSNQFGFKEAREWAEEVLPNGLEPGIERRDTEELKAAGFDVETVARARQEAMAWDRLSEERISTMCDPLIIPAAERPAFIQDVLLLRDLVKGVRIPVPDGFEPSNSVPAFRKKYVQAQGAVTALLYDFYKKGLCLLVDLESAKKIAGVHLGNYFSWALKSGKKSGRQCGDTKEFNVKTCKRACF